MAERHPIRAAFRTFKTTFGILSVGACLALMSPGITAVRADATTPATPPLDVVPAEIDGEIDSAPRAVDPELESVPGVVNLNTRGYNYGPDRPTTRPVVPPAPNAADDGAR
jgi:hypothetical protein